MSNPAVYPPSPEFSLKAHVKSIEEYNELHRIATSDPEGFWGKIAEREIYWFEPWTKVLEWESPYAKWFVGAKTNISYNCLDRHLTDGRKDKVAIQWEGEPVDANGKATETRAITYQELHRLVVRFASVLKAKGYKQGDRAILYMPMIPELPIAMLACTRLGIIHSVVFGGFSAEALKTRIQDLDAQIVITADGGYRRGKEVKLKPAVDEALEECPNVQDVIVYQRTKSELPMKDGRDHWWHELDKTATEDCPAVPLDAEHIAYVLYTSGTTGKPKGIQHSTGGYLTYITATMKWIFDIREEDVYWCAADVGWVTGHSYIVYGPLSAGTTTVMYEGSPDYPKFDRWWQIVEKYKVNILYTSPTAIRALIRQGDELPNSHNLSSLRLLGSVGEPINPAAWEWYYTVIGKERCPIIDTWWQTETGGALISPMPGAVPQKPGSGTLPMPGLVPEIVDGKGNPVPQGNEGFLTMKAPWPAMLRGIWGDPERYEKQYWSQVPGAYFTGDAARMDEDGYYWILGRVDDVMNVSGHRLSTMEIESALVKHPMVAEAAVVGKPDEITGQAVCCFVTLKKGDGEHNHHDLGQELREWVATEIGKFARPKEVRFTEALPKTRSGKIMRRLLREIVTSHEVHGDVTTLEDMNVVSKLAAQHDEED